MTDIYPIGSQPPIGEVPKRMYAQTVRQDRFGDPQKAFQIEEIDTPEIKANEVLIASMAAGINFNNVWAARGIPIDVIRLRQKMGEPYDFHIGGMVVICAGTTGYSATLDLRYHWVRQKRLQGSHGANDEQANAYNQLVIDRKIDPCLGDVYSFENIGKAH